MGINNEERTECESVGQPIKRETSKRENAKRRRVEGENGHTVKRIDVPKAQVGRLAMEKREIVKPRNKI